MGIAERNKMLKEVQDAIASLRDFLVTAPNFSPTLHETLRKLEEKQAALKAGAEPEPTAMPDPWGQMQELNQCLMTAVAALTVAVKQASEPYTDYSIDDDEEEETETGDDAGAAFTIGVLTGLVLCVLIWAITRLIG